jgi:predicted secreted Zn-dependent protease
MWATIFALLFSGFFIFPGSASAEPEVHVDHEYYEIRGETAEQLRQAMNAQGTMWKNGKTYDAFTSWNVSWSFDRRTGRNGCYLDSVRTVVKVTHRFPRWKDRLFAPLDLQEKWNGYMKALRKHENGHKDIALGAAREIESSLINLDPSPNCEEIRVRANELAREILRKYEEQEAEYDVTTRFGETQGAVFP